VRAVVWEAPPAAGEAGAASSPPAPEKGKGARLPPPCRLLRVEQAVFENSKDRHSAPQREKWAQMPLLVLHCQRWDTRSQRWQPWVLLTNLPLSAEGQQAGPYTFAEVPELYRRRWEIETFFKFLKQHLSYAHLTSRCENGIRVLIWMALITAVVLLWYKQASGIDRGWRSVKFWLAEDVREWTGALLAGKAWVWIPQESG
jgi:Transposase DDE domain